MEHVNALFIGTIVGIFTELIMRDTRKSYLSKCFQNKLKCLFSISIYSIVFLFVSIYRKEILNLKLYEQFLFLFVFITIFEYGWYLLLDRLWNGDKDILWIYPKEYIHLNHHSVSVMTSLFFSVLLFIFLHVKSI